VARHLAGDCLYTYSSNNTYVATKGETFPDNGRLVFIGKPVCL